MVWPLRITTLCVPVGPVVVVTTAVPEPGVAAKAAAKVEYVSQVVGSFQLPEVSVAQTV